MWHRIMANIAQCEGGIGQAFHSEENPFLPEDFVPLKFLLGKNCSGYYQPINSSRDMKVCRAGGCEILGMLVRNHGPGRCFVSVALHSCEPDLKGNTLHRHRPTYSLMPSCLGMPPSISS